MNKKTVAIMIFLGLLIVISACSKINSNDLVNINLRLKWLHQAQFAGNYIAKEKGFYEDNGLDVELLEGGVESPSLPDVISGNSQYGIAGADDIIVAVSKGMPVKAIAVIYKFSPVTYFSLDESIKTPYDWVGKKIGIKEGTGTTYSYISMLNELDIDRSSITEISVGYDLNMLYDGEVDVWPGFRINEPFTAEKKGYKVYQVYPEEWGVTMYADVLFTTTDRIKNNPDEVNAFVQATLKGWQYAIENKKESVDIVMYYAATQREDQDFMLEKSIPLIHTGDNRLGYMEENLWQNQVNILLENSVIEHEISVEDIFTNEFVD